MQNKLNSTILKSISKPGRYAGGEYGAIIKDKTKVKARFAFAFPDTYEIGMSNLGVRILYGALNSFENIWCERVYCPWTDMQEKMKEYNIPLVAQESRDPIKDFDFVGFTLQYEMSYTNVLSMLKMAEIPIRTENRQENDPIIIGGGPCAYNPEPLADFFDIFNIGEGEELLPEIVNLYIKMKEEGRYTRSAFLHECAKTIEGVYVPSLYDVTDNEDGTIKAYTPIYEDIPKTIRKRIIKDLDTVYYPDKVVMPYIETVHDRIMLEVYRGCIRGCRFCQAGMIYRPVREKSADTLNEYAKKLHKATGYDEISLSSLSISDYTEVEPLCDKLLSWTDDSMVSLSLPSLRVDNFSKRLMDRIDSVRSSSLTFAPEAGTQRLRDVINKNATEEELMRTVNIAFDAGKTNVKLYFMNGLPTETDEDIKGIATLAEKVVNEFYKNPNHCKRPPQVTISVACFIPKPFTAFQWEKQDTMEELERKQQVLKEAITNRHVRYQHHDAGVSFVEAILARGNRKLCKTLELCLERGFAFDAWDEGFNFEAWMQAFKDSNINPDFYIYRKYSFDEILPWDIIDCGVHKEFFVREAKKAYEATTTPNCREHCSGCGASKLGGKNCVCPNMHKEPEPYIPPEPTLKKEKTPEEISAMSNPENFHAVRLKFRKVGNSQYFSHLDLQRTMSRVLKRANIPMWFTQGFNPHAKVSFGPPLSVGMESETEFIDLRLAGDMPFEEIKARLNNELTEEMQVLDCYESDKKFSDIGFASYEIEWNFPSASTYKTTFEDFIKSPIIVTKKTKSGEKEVDIAPHINNFTCKAKDENTLAFEMLLPCGDELNVSPELFVGACKKELNLPLEDLSTWQVKILRKQVFEKDGITLFH